eukprot:SAG11_NODE_259_length_11534_cov_3.402361_14_plen_326_part_00
MATGEWIAAAQSAQSLRNDASVPSGDHISASPSSTSLNWKQLIGSVYLEANRLKCQHARLLALVSAWRPGHMETDREAGVNLDHFMMESDSSAATAVLNAQPNPPHDSIRAQLEAILISLGGLRLKELFVMVREKADAASELCHSAPQENADHDGDGSKQFGTSYDALKRYTISLRQRLQSIAEEIARAPRDQHADRSHTVDVLRNQLLAKDTELRMMREDIAEAHRIQGSSSDPLVRSEQWQSLLSKQYGNIVRTEERDRDTSERSACVHREWNRTWAALHAETKRAEASQAALREAQRSHAAQALSFNKAVRALRMEIARFAI